MTTKFVQNVQNNMISVGATHVVEVVRNFFRGAGEHRALALCGCCGLLRGVRQVVMASQPRTRAVGTLPPGIAEAELNVQALRHSSDHRDGQLRVMIQLGYWGDESDTDSGSDADGDAEEWHSRE